MQLVMMNRVRYIIIIGIKVKFVMCSNDCYSMFPISANVIARHPIVLPIVPANVNKKLGFISPF